MRAILCVLGCCGSLVYILKECWFVLLCGGCLDMWWGRYDVVFWVFDICHLLRLWCFGVLLLSIADLWVYSV